MSHTETLKTVFFAYFHTLVKYGIIFRDNSVNTKKRNSYYKKSMVRIMMATKTEMFWYRNVEKSQTYYQYHVLFVVDNHDKFQSNSSLHCINTRHKDRLHIPRVNPIYKKGLLILL